MLTAWGTRLKSDILKVPHHGAQGFDPAFLDAVTPSAAVISCGINNRYGHPGESTETLLGQVSSHVYRTDRDGSITVSVPSMQVSAY